MNIKLKNRGVILVTTLLFITIIVMFSVLVVQSGKDALMTGARYSDSEQAYLAALSGIDYARGELFMSRDWGADGELGTKAGLDNGIIIEKSGSNIVGYLGCSDGTLNTSIASFAISFTPTAAAAAQISASNKKAKVNPFISLNNLDSADPMTIEENSNLRRTVPAHSFYIVSKGVCGKTVKYVEAVLAPDGFSNINGSTMLNGDVIVRSDWQDTDKPFFTVQHANGNSPGKITAAGSLSLETPDYSKQSINWNNYLQALDIKNHGTISSNCLKGISGNTTTVKYSAPGDEQDAEFDMDFAFNKNSFDGTVEGNFEDIASDFTKVVETCTNAPVGTLTNGTYAYVRSDPVNTPEVGVWKYIPTDMRNLESSNLKTFTPDYVESAKTVINAQDTAAVSYYENAHNELMDNSIVVPAKNVIKFYDRTVSVSDSIHSSSATEQGPDNKVPTSINFVVLDKVDGIYSISNEDTVDFQMGENGSIVSDNDVSIFGELIGSGKIISNGSVSFNGGSSFETAPNSGVAVWSAGDLNITAAQNTSITTYQTQIETMEDLGLIEDDLVADLNSDDDSNSPENIVTYNFTSDITAEMQDDRGVYYPGCYFLDSSLIKLTSSSGNIFYNNFERSDTYALTNTLSRRLNIALLNYNDRVDSYQDAIAHGCNSIECYNVRYTPEAFKNRFIDGYSDFEEGGFIYDPTSKTLTVDFTATPIVRLTQNNNDFLLQLKISADVNIECEEVASDGTLNYLGVSKIDIGAPECTYYIFPDRSGNAPLTSGELKIKLNNSAAGSNGHVLTVTPADIKTDEILDSNLATIEENTRRRAEREVIRAIKVNNPNIGNTVIKGSLYSQGGKINVNAMGKSFNILGAIFTYGANGDLIFDNVQDVTLTYHPDYVPFFEDIGIITSFRFMSSFDY